MLQLIKLGFKFGFYFLAIFAVGLSYSFCIDGMYWSVEVLLFNTSFSVNSIVISLGVVLRILLVISVYLYLRKVRNYKWWKSLLITPLVDMVFTMIIALVLFFQKFGKTFFGIINDTKLTSKESSLKIKKMDSSGETFEELKALFSTTDFSDLSFELLIGCLVYIGAVLIGLFYTNRRLKKVIS